jgi:hypothetical protein
MLGFFRRAVQLPLQCVDAPKLVIDAAFDCARNFFGRIDSAMLKVSFLWLE